MEAENHRSTTRKRRSFLVLSTDLVSIGGSEGLKLPAGGDWTVFIHLLSVRRTRAISIFKLPARGARAVFYLLLPARSTRAECLSF
jgi:hypothetical protein